MNEGSNLSRRGFIGGAAIGTAAVAVGCGSSSKATSTSTTATTATTAANFPHPQTPDEAIQVLREGNRRYINGQLELRDYSPVSEQIAKTQAPFAAIITCADSRITPSLLFDIFAGNLFVSRIAGNTVDTGTLGSTEYAVAKLGVKVLLVLGHSDCGAVKAAIGVADGSAHFPSDHYGSIGTVIEPIVATAKALPADKRNVVDVTLANAQEQAKIIAAKDPIVAPAVKAGKLKVVSSVYDIASGEVPL